MAFEVDDTYTCPAETDREARLENGYDSDSLRGPFRGAVIDEGDEEQLYDEHIDFIPEEAPPNHNDTSTTAERVNNNRIFPETAYWESLSPKVEVVETLTTTNSDVLNDASTAHQATQNNNIPRERGHVKESFIRKHNLSVLSTPEEWFRAFLPDDENIAHQDQKFVIFGGEKYTSILDEWCSSTNMRAVLSNAGNQGYAYPDFKPFTVPEIKKHIALYFLNALSLAPDVEMKFKSIDEDPLCGSEICHRVFGPNAIRRHKHFKEFFSLRDPRTVSPPRDAHPNFKVDELNRHIHNVSAEAWEPGVSLYGEKETIGIVKKKRLGEMSMGLDEFQNAATVLCDGDFTLSFVFRNEPPPEKYLKQGLSPQHARAMTLLDALESKHHRVWFDNLNVCPRFVKAAWLHEKKVSISGVAQEDGRGLPACVLQPDLTEEEGGVEGTETVKAAILKGDSDFTDYLVAASYHNDAMPVYFLSLVGGESANIKWNPKEGMAYCVDTGTIKFPDPGCNDDGMDDDSFIVDEDSDDDDDDVGIVDRYDHWMTKRKWWWPFFFWGMHLLQTNAYACYKDFMETNGKKEDALSRYEFLKSICLAWLDPQTCGGTNNGGKEDPPPRKKQKNNDSQRATSRGRKRTLRSR